jgi:hypothetical protein
MASYTNIISVFGTKNDVTTTHINIKIEAIENFKKIGYKITSNLPITDDYNEHPFKGITMNDSNYYITDFIENTPSTKCLINDIINFKNPSYNLKYYTFDYEKNKYSNIVNLKAIKNDTKYLIETIIPIKLKVQVLKLFNNKLAIKITTNIKVNESFETHPFLRIFKKGCTSSKLVGIFSDTTTINSMIGDLIKPTEHELYTTRDMDYRSKIISNLNTLMIRDKEVSDCEILNKMISSLFIHYC